MRVEAADGAVADRGPGASAELVAASSRVTVIRDMAIGASTGPSSHGYVPCGAGWFGNRVVLDRRLIQRHLANRGSGGGTVPRVPIGR